MFTAFFFRLPRLIIISIFNHIQTLCILMSFFFPLIIKFLFFSLFQFFFSLAGCLLLNVASLIIIPPPGKPDLFPVLISIYSCFHFVLFLFYLHYVQFTVNSQTSKASSGKLSQKVTSLNRSSQIPGSYQGKVKKQWHLLGK